MKTILITGATSGIGKATAYLLASQKHRLILCGRNQQKLKEIEQELSLQTQVTTLAFDVRDFGQVESQILGLPKEWFEIDVLLNNAGNAHGLDELSESSVEDIDAMMDGNVKGLLYVSKVVIPRMKERKHGQIINISSIAGLQIYPKSITYCASKKAVQAISEGMRLELIEYGIRVSDIAPGAAETNFSSVRFKGDEDRSSNVYKGFEPLTPHDLAEAISYVISQPERVCVSSMVIYPTAQASTTKIIKK